MSGMARVTLPHPLVFDAGTLKTPTLPGPHKSPSGFPAHALLGCATAPSLGDTGLWDTSPALRICQSVLLVVQERRASLLFPEPARAPVTGSPLLGQR